MENNVYKEILEEAYGIKIKEEADCFIVKDKKGMFFNINKNKKGKYGLLEDLCLINTYDIEIRTMIIKAITVFAKNANVKKC